MEKKRKRGKRGARQNEELLQNSDHRDVSNNSILVKFSLLNARLLKANEFIIRDELDSSNAEFTVITETTRKCD